MAVPHLRVAVVGCGTGGPAAARFLGRLGHEVTVFERFPDPQPVGAGILLQPTGQGVLRRLGLFDRVAAGSSVIDRVYAVSHRGRPVMDFGYGDVTPGQHALGVHRGLLFHTLVDGLGIAPEIELRLGVEVTVAAGNRPGAGWATWPAGGTARSISWWRPMAPARRSDGRPTWSVGTRSIHGARSGPSSTTPVIDTPQCSINTTGAPGSRSGCCRPDRPPTGRGACRCTGRSRTAGSTSSTGAGSTGSRTRSGA